MVDVKQMFDNAKYYNEDDSQIYKYAVELQVRRNQPLGWTGSDRFLGHC